MAHRVGYRCSMPDCRIPTRGAASDDDGTINVGFAAHISAASPEGPRYDPTLTIEQRKHHSNGIWLCGTHAKLVDSDKDHFTVEELAKWKQLAEHRSFLEVVSSSQAPTGAVFADDEDLQTAFDLLQEYSKSDLLAFQGVPGWPPHAVALNLRLVDGDAKSFTVSGLASGIDKFDQVTVVAPPGTGKTTTLLQLVEATLVNAAAVPVFIPLSEWSTGTDTFLQSLLKRVAFRDARVRQLELLAKHGKLVLILDGWNELDEASRRRMGNDVKALRRDFPNIHLVISSRYKDFDIPIDGQVVEVELLTEEQQLELAKALRAAEGESLMDHAWRTSGLRELVAIPLYLTALLKQALGGSLPTTKEEVLRSFVAELEQDRDKLATLGEVLQGFHREYLEEIGVETTRQETVTLSKKQACAVVYAVQERLKAENQIAQLLNPNKLLDALINTHMLVRPGFESGGVSFQHQQFQEWFASFRVQQLMLSATSGDVDAIKRLREFVLDIPVWEEAILFACERLSRADQDGINAVSLTILETIGIDPLLSAEMIWRSSDMVWEQISEDIISYVGKWHTSGRVDRAVKFMIDTGRAEFSEHVWPLISDPNDQIHLPALRAGRRFRPSILGSDVEQRIADLPEKVRKHVISEIASNSGMDGIEFATSLAKNDTSSEVKTSVIGYLMFRRANRFAEEILQSAPDEVWRSLARNWYPSEFSDPEVSARIHEEVEKLFVEETDPVKILNNLLSTNVRDPSAGQKVRELVERIDYSGEGQGNKWVTRRAYELYPGDVVTGLLLLLEQGKQVPFQADEMLRLSDVVIDEGPLVDLVLENSEEVRAATTAASVVGEKIVCQLIDRMFAVHASIREDNGGYNKSFGDEYNRSKDLITGTKIDAFMQAVLARASTEKPNEICILADLISRHGGSVERKPLRLDTSTHEKATAAVQRWAKTLLASPEATREQFAEIARAAERLESPKLVPVLLELLSEDLTRRKRAIKEFLDAQRGGRQIQNDGNVDFSLLYRRALAAIGDEQTVAAMKTYLQGSEFGIDAAYVLKEVWRKSQPQEGGESGLMKSFPDYSVVPDAYKKRQSGSAEKTHPLVNDIFATIDDLINPGADGANLKHALNLAAVAFSMPYVDKEETIVALLKLPVPVVNKRDLLTSLVLSGEVISSEIVLRGIDEFLEDAKVKTWMLQENNGWRLKKWLELLPFTERPAAILEVLNQVEGFRIEPWNLRELLSALGNAPSAETETVLDALAKRDERFLSEYGWLAALVRRNTMSSARFLLGLICNASFTESRGKLDHADLSRNLSSFMVSHDQFRKDVYERFPSLDDGPAKSVLEYAIAEAADVEGVLLITREGAARNKRLPSTSLYAALRHMLIGQTPAESSGTQQLYSLPAPELRKGLFDMVVNGNTGELRLATECLSAIDEIRDDYGHVDVEPRHPDIATGIPWPRIEWKGEQFRSNLGVSAGGESEELPNKGKMDLAEAADDIFKFNIPVVPGLINVNLNNAIKHLGDWWNKWKNRK